MSAFELLILALGLSADACAASVTLGLSTNPKNRLSLFGYATLVGVFFGGAQAGMPAIGYVLGSRFTEFVSGIDHWIAFVLLSLIGGGMIRDSFSKEEQKQPPHTVLRLFILALATSIDALAAGVTFAFLQIDLLSALLCIGWVTFVMSAGGVLVGKQVGAKFQTAAQRIGGGVLVALGVKILVGGLMGN